MNGRLKCRIGIGQVGAWIAYADGIYLIALRNHAIGNKYIHGLVRFSIEQFHSLQPTGDKWPVNTSDGGRRDGASVGACTCSF